jgi:two-component system OmpR family response regulator
MDPSPHILIVDDHKDIRDLVAKYLQLHGLRVAKAENAAAARRLLPAGAFDLVVLDIMMPGEDGLSLCRHLREATDIPVILLTAMADETDRVVGLELGADDYLTKPFNPRELLARIKAVLRRAQSLPRTREPAAGQRLAFDHWVLAVDRRELEGRDQVAVPLSSGEFLLLSAFLNHPNMVLSRDQLLDLTKGRQAALFDRSVDNQVSRLRKKIERDPKNPKLIQTVWGGGYKLASKVSRL